VPSVTQQNVEYMLYIHASRLSILQVPNEFQNINKRIKQNKKYNYFKIGFVHFIIIVTGSGVALSSLKSMLRKKSHNNNSSTEGKRCSGC
jgi:hypothetical protein